MRLVCAVNSVLMNIKKLTLYHFPATRSVRARWALLETVGEAFDVKHVALYKGAQYAPEFLQKNPNHNVPLLEITFADGKVHAMLESAAMVQWLADAFPEKELAPRPDMSADRADYLQMIHFGAGWMDMMLWQIRIHEHLLPTADVNPRTIERYRQKCQQEVEPQLIQRLQALPFICGETFTAADIVIAYNVGWARRYGLCQDPIFKDYLTRVSRRPAFVEAYSDAGDFELEIPDRDRTRNF